MKIKEKYLNNMMQIFRTIHRMKYLPRQGEIYFGMTRTESDSIASHTFLVTWIARILAETVGRTLFKSQHKKRSKFIREVTYCALVHDVSESVMGDLYYKTKERIKHFTEINIEAIVVNSMMKKIKGSSLKRYFDIYENPQDEDDYKIAAIVKFADGFDAWLHGLSTAGAWWPAWENYNRMVHEKIKEFEEKGEIENGVISNIFRRMCDIAHYPDFDIKIQSNNLTIKDVDLHKLVTCFKKLYTLKSLPRHGFTIFGMKRAETDTFAEHIFTSSFLSFLLADLLIKNDKDKTKIIEKATLFCLLHDLPSSISGDVTFDLQNLIKGWHDIQKEYICELLGSNYSDMLISYYQPQTKQDRIAASISKAAALIDSWEIGITTPSSWKDHWKQYKDETISIINKWCPEIGDITNRSCDILKSKDGNAEFLIQPYRLKTLNL